MTAQLCLPAVYRGVVFVKTTCDADMMGQAFVESSVVLMEAFHQHYDNILVVGEPQQLDLDCLPGLY